MPFAPRRLEDKTIRLCQRKGPTHIYFHHNHEHEIRFPTYPAAVAACAELNDNWEEYRTSRLKRNPTTPPVQKFFDILDKHGAIHDVQT